MELTQVSIVVRSQGNNPSILNADFLSYNGIVPAGWKTQQVVVLPVLSQVRYENGVEVKLEPNRLQVMSTNPGQFEWREDLPTIVIAFLRTLPHVKYESVGLNFDVIESLDHDQDTRAAFTSALLCDGDWLNFDRPATLDEIKLKFIFEEYLLTLTVNVTSREIDNEIQYAMGFHANFHNQLTHEQDDARHTYIGTLNEKYDLLSHLVSRFPLVRK